MVVDSRLVVVKFLIVLDPAKVAAVVFLGSVDVVNSAPLLEVVVGALELVIEVRFGVDVGLSTLIDILKPCDVAALGTGEVILVWVFGKIVEAFWFGSADDVLSCVVVPNNKKYATKKSVIKQSYVLYCFILSLF